MSIHLRSCPRCLTGAIVEELGDLVCINCGRRVYPVKPHASITFSPLGDALPDKIVSTSVSRRCKGCGRWISLARIENHHCGGKL